jgi:hypothetical protein
MSRQPPATGSTSAAFFRHAVATAIVFAVNITLTTLLREVVGLPPSAAFGFSLTVVFFLAFALMRFYVYRGGAQSWTRQFALYAPSAAAFRLVEYVAFTALDSILDIDYRVLVTAVLAVSWVAKFYYYRVTVFR